MSLLADKQYQRQHIQTIARNRELRSSLVELLPLVKTQLQMHGHELSPDIRLYLEGVIQRADYALERNRRAASSHGTPTGASVDLA